MYLGVWGVGVDKKMWPPIRTTVRIRHTFCKLAVDVEKYKKKTFGKTK